MSLLDRLGRPPPVAALDGEDAVYVVGGAVRDLLLGRDPRELDFVVEGDAVAVARRAAGRLGGRVTVHERFGTATVIAPEVVFDVVGARRERYERPGALPEVELGASLREDLARRDFTVNAIGLHLVDGELVEYPGAREDLRTGVLRVLHEGSFLDDPTRLLRLARYSARLGFEPEPQTDVLAAASVGAVETVTGPRLGAELRLLVREPQPSALVALERHGLGEAILGPGFQADPELIVHAQRLCPPDGRRDLVALAATLANTPLPKADLSATLDRLAFPAGDRAIVAVAASGAFRLGEAFEPENEEQPRLDPVHLWRILGRRPPEVVALAGAIWEGRPAEEAARRWLEDVRHRALSVNGDDFVAAGLSGPPVGDALEAATEAMLEGRATTREEQLAAGLAAVGVRRSI